jgi:hypothetical protein
VREDDAPSLILIGSAYLLEGSYKDAEYFIRKALADLKPAAGQKIQIHARKRLFEAMMERDHYVHHSLSLNSFRPGKVL